jgi:hypothetical protein
MTKDDIENLLYFLGGVFQSWFQSVEVVRNVPKAKDVQF